MEEGRQNTGAQMQVGWRGDEVVVPFRLRSIFSMRCAVKALAKELGKERAGDLRRRRYEKTGVVQNKTVISLTKYSAVLGSAD